jgi:hypothetical protein
VTQKHISPFPRHFTVCDFEHITFLSTKNLHNSNAHIAKEQDTETIAIFSFLSTPYFYYEDIREYRATQWYIMTKE